MHELSLSSAIVATVTKHAGGHRVSAVNVRVGALRQVVPESLDFYFSFAARDTVCEGAALNLATIPAGLRCSACAHEWTLEGPVFKCPSCRSPDVAVVTGNEFEVETIDVSEEEWLAPSSQS